MTNDNSSRDDTLLEAWLRTHARTQSELSCSIYYEIERLRFQLQCAIDQNVELRQQLDEAQQVYRSQYLQSFAPDESDGAFR